MQYFQLNGVKLLLRKPEAYRKKNEDEIALPINDELNDFEDNDDCDIESLLQPRRFGTSTSLASSIPVAEFQGRLLQEMQGNNNNNNVKNHHQQGRPGGSLAVPREPLDATTVVEAISVISCFYEERTEWGKRVGWIYDSVIEDVVMGYRMHNRGWRSVYCVTKRDAFRGTAPINLTDRLHQVLRWATGSVEIFFLRNNALFATRHSPDEVPPESGLLQCRDVPFHVILPNRILHPLGDIIFYRRSITGPVSVAGFHS